MPQNMPVQRLKYGNPTTGLPSSRFVTCPRELKTTFMPQCWAMPMGLSSKAISMRKLDFSNFLSCHYFPLVIVRGLAAVRGWKGSGQLRSFLVGLLKPGLSLALEHAFGTWSCTSVSTSFYTGQPRRTCLLSWLRCPRGSTIRYEHKLEIQCLACISKIIFLVACCFIPNVGPRWLGARQKRYFLWL